MGWVNINGNWIGRNRGSGSGSTYWTPSSAVVENAAPTDIVLTYDKAVNPADAIAGNFAVAGKTISSATLDGTRKILTLVVTVAFFYGDVITVIANGENISVTNNCAVPAEYTTVYNAFTTKPTGALTNIIPNTNLTTIDQSQARMVDVLVKTGIWAKRDRYLFFSCPTNDGGEALKNWKNPGTGDALLVGSPTFEANMGITTAPGKYIRSVYNPATDGDKYTVISHSIAIGIGTDVIENGFDFGGMNIGLNNGVGLNTGIPGNYALAYDYKQYQNIPRAGTKGHWYQNRNDNSLELYKSTVKTSYTETPNAIESAEIFIGAQNRAGVGAINPTTKQYRWFAVGGYLTMDEVKIETQAVEDYLYSINANIHPYASANDLTFNVTGAITVTLEASRSASSALSVIDWGDGTNILIAETTPATYAHTYSVDEAHTIVISHANSINYLRFGYNTISNLEGDIARLNVCGALETLGIHLLENQWTGSVTGLSKTIKSLYIQNQVGLGQVVTGSLTGFDDLEVLNMSAPVTGNLASNTSLTHITLGDNTGIELTIDITNKPNITVIVSDAPNSWIGGDITNKTSLIQICCGVTPNGFYGDISTCPDFEYLDNYGDSYMHGDISALTSIYRFRSYNCSNAFTGAITNLTALCEFSVMNDNSVIDRPATIDNKPLLNLFQHDGWSFTEAEVNQILADKWADRNAAYNAALTTRLINLSTGTSAAPTGQGITDRDALRAYRSPTPPGTAALWTILTN